MGKLFTGRVWNTDGTEKDFENLTEAEIRRVADIRNPEVARAKYHEVLDTGDDN